MPRQTRSQRGHYLLLRWNDLLSWQKDNEFILTGYRPVSGSFRKSLTSLQHVHNEIVNIYSHLLGAILFAILPIYVSIRVRNQHSAIQIGDVIGFATFFFGVVLCFSLSASFHIMSNHIYYGFYCDQNLQKLYWAVVSILAVVCTIATFTPKFRHPTFRPYRTAMYAFLGLSSIVFITHGLIIYGWEVQNHRMSLLYMLITAMLNLLGAVVYAAKIPERWFPLRYDIYGCSHQIFHCIAVFASFIHMSGLLSAFSFIHSQAQLCLKTEARNYN
ncbi:mPR-like GPCR protein [Bisporella sp. PMI_857]|nr:mPR-like GPCR protein [Bisporella sp. PMI_857]